MGPAGGNHQGAAGAGLLDYIIDEVVMIQRLGDCILKYISHSASCNVVRNTVIALIIAWREGGKDECQVDELLLFGYGRSFWYRHVVRDPRIMPAD
jgi:hypothetical protein